jgi:signal peptidase II
MQKILHYLKATYIYIVFWLIWIDAVTKIWAENLINTQIVLIPGIFSLEYAQNTGIAFSLPLNGIILKVVTVILIFWIFYYYWVQEKPKNSKMLNFWYSLIFAWALWNAWERIFQGYVTDFLSVEYFAIFNLADSYITLWALCIFYFYYKHS